MFSAIKGMFGKNNKNETNSVRSPDDISTFNSLVKKGPKTVVLIHADWCGPCQNYKPMWKELESTPGRIANMAMVHHDMVEKIDLLKNAKIPGYPSVLKLFPDGRIEEYNDKSKKSTNSLPHMRDVGSMVTELKTLGPKEQKSAVIKPTSNFNMKIASKNRDDLRKSRTAVTRKNKVSMPKVKISRKPLVSPRMPMASPGMPLASPSMPMASLSMPMVQISRMPMASPSMPMASLSMPMASPRMPMASPSMPMDSPRMPMASPSMPMASPSMPIQMAQTPVPAQIRPAFQPNPNIRQRTPLNSVKLNPVMKGGLYSALSSALMKAAPASFLFGVSQMLPPKKNRGSTKRLTRKSRSRR
jgi:thiol-disulfide isomerase/thioredoxin